jgi:C1A family cysteine protease
VRIREFSTDTESARHLRNKLRIAQIDALSTSIHDLWRRKKIANSQSPATLGAMKITKAQWMGVLLVGVSGASAFASAQKVVDVQSVQKELTRSHATWQAKESWVTKLSGDEIHRMLGLREVPKGQLDFQSIHALGTTPTSLDWRNMNGVNWLGPVMNQGNCGSCVAFSTVATLEAQTSISAGLPWLHPTYSPEMLFMCGGAQCETGWMPDDASDFLKNTGVVDEACMPYTSGSTGEDISCSQQCADSKTRTTRIAGYDTPTSYGGSVDDVKAALKKGPLVTTLLVYADFMTYGGGVYKHTTGKALGGHAVSIVGYDDAKQAWLIRNSWGQEWGDHGFAWVSWQDISGVGANTWHFDIAPSTGYLSVSSPADKEYVSGQYQLSAQIKNARADDIQFHVSGDDGRAVAVACSVSGERCDASIDTTSLKEGRYEVYATSAANPSLRSQTREFFVINSEPKMSLSFVAAPGTDLSQPQNDRPEFNITVKSSPVPIQHLEFRAIDPSGKVVDRKTNDLVLPEMRMGWRTMMVKDGKYTILFHGETTYKGKVYSVDSNSYSVTVKN